MSWYPIRKWADGRINYENENEKKQNFQNLFKPRFFYIFRQKQSKHCYPYFLLPIMLTSTEVVFDCQRFSVISHVHWGDSVFFFSHEWTPSALWCASLGHTLGIKLLNLWCLPCLAFWKSVQILKHFSTSIARASQTKDLLDLLALLRITGSWYLGETAKEAVVLPKYDVAGSLAPITLVLFLIRPTLSGAGEMDLELCSDAVFIQCAHSTLT